MITYLTGDASDPIGKRPCIITHVVNDIGAWGAGFVLAVSKKYPRDHIVYKHWIEGSGPFKVPGWKGTILPIPHDDGVTDVLLLAQRGVGRRHGSIPLDYMYLAASLLELSTYGDGQPIHMPRIGCGLAGGTWDRVGPLVENYLRDREVYVYDLPVSR
jgi:hypothetical protein